MARMHAKTHRIHDASNTKQPCFPFTFQAHLHSTITTTPTPYPASPAVWKEAAPRDPTRSI